MTLVNGEPLGSERVNNMPQWKTIHKIEIVSRSVLWSFLDLFLPYFKIREFKI